MRKRFTRLLNSVWYGHSSFWILLWPLSLLYRVLYTLVQMLPATPAGSDLALRVPLVVVGNITAGGAGKTPLIIWLARALGRRGRRIGVVSRGYGGAEQKLPRMVKEDSPPSDVGDEPVLIARATGCPVAVCSDRMRARALLESEHALDLILSDDGLQNARLERSCEIVVVDGERGLGNGMLLPAGPLRESPERLNRADAVVVNGGHWQHERAIRAAIRPVRVVRLGDGAERSLEEFRGQRVHAVAGIGNPDRFFSMLREHGIVVTEHPLPDHARLDREDLPLESDALVMLTSKDAVKIPADIGQNTWCVEIEMTMPEADEKRLLEIVERCSGCTS